MSSNNMLRSLSQAQIKYSIIAACLIIFAYTFLLPRVTPEGGLHGGTTHKSSLSPREQAANSTLGVQHIFTLSTGPSWRTRGLLSAAEIAGIEIKIPKHPYTSPELGVAFEQIGSPEVKHPPHGSAMAWLAHLDMLKFVVANDYDTVLILEDDVDWDVDIRNQMKLISDNVRNFTMAASDDTTPYGSNWDVLWIGHCGEVTHPDTARLEFSDATAQAPELYAGWSKLWRMNVPDGYRAVQKAVQPVCSFGYITNRRGAMKILEYSGKGQNEAFDISMMTGCQERKLDCVVVQPELMHHYNPPFGSGYVSSVGALDGKGIPVDESVFEKNMGTTANIINSARCKALFENTCPQGPS